MGWDDSDDDWDVDATSAYKEHTGFTDEEEEEEEVPKQNPAVTAAKAPASTKPKKKTMKQVIAEKEAIEKEKQAERDAFQREAAAAEAKMTNEEKIARRKEQQLRSDLENAQDLFAATGDEVEDEKPNYEFIPKTVTDFTAYSKLLTSHFKKFSNEKPYQTFVEEFVRALSQDMSIDDVKALSSVLTVQLNIKTQAQRAKDSSKGKKKNKKPSLKAAQQTTDDGSRYDEMYEDFM